MGISSKSDFSTNPRENAAAAVARVQVVSQCVRRTTDESRAADEPRPPHNLEDASWRIVTAIYPQPR